MNRFFITGAAFVFLLGVGILAHAQAIVPHSYEFHCNGQDDAGHIVAESGTIEFTSATAAVGFAGLNLSNGVIRLKESFTGSFTNGTASPQGVGGNGIPRGCFTGSLTLPGDTFGVNSGFFGCYNETTHGFSWEETDGSVTCVGTEM